MNTNFTELSMVEMEAIDGGKSGWDWLGDICGTTCAVCGAILVAGSGPVGWATYAAAAGAAAWVAYKS